jgi:hypothetical protein
MFRKRGEYKVTVEDKTYGFFDFVRDLLIVLVCGTISLGLLAGAIGAM